MKVIVGVSKRVAVEGERVNLQIFFHFFINLFCLLWKHKAKASVTKPTLNDPMVGQHHIKISENTSYACESAMTLYISTSDANGVIFGSGVEFGLLSPRARALIIVRASTLVRG